MRTENSIKNIGMGLFGQFLSIVIAFITRTVFIHTLGGEYLGVEGLFSNILSLLSLTNLGMETAIIYSLYKPLNEKNWIEVKGYMNLYAKVYRLMGIITLIIGLTLLPFLSFFIKGDVKIPENIKLIYMLFLINSVASYFYIYKKSILMANQQNYIISSIHIKYIVVSNFFQIVILVVFKQYIVVLVTQLLMRVIENLSISHRADKEFLCLQDESIKGELSHREKKILYKNVYSMFLYKISGTVINSTDNIVISKFVGVLYVGIYSNYLLITSTVKTLLSYVFYSLTASVGNLMVTEDKEKQEFIYNEIFFLSAWAYGFSSVCLYVLMNQFINIWLGEKYILSYFTVLMIIIDFYTAGMQNPSTTYRDTTGLFGIGKYRPIIAALINIVVSVILASKLQIAGVLIGTIVSRLCVYFWFDPYIIHKNLFNKGISKYFKKYIFNILLLIAVTAITSRICNIVKISSIYISFLFKMLICLVIPNTIYFIIYRKTDYFKYIVNIFKLYLDKFKKRLSFRYS